LKFISIGAGYEFDNNASGKCIKKNGAVTHAGASASSCHYYEPSREAKKLM
jgi:hypothetical protein